MGGRLELVHDDEGQPAGRISLFDPEMMAEDNTYPTASIVTAGPARTNTSLSSTAGILLGRPYGAAREAAVPIAGYSSMGAWVDSQISALSNLSKGRSDGWSTVLAELAWRFGRDARQLHCWLTKDGWLNYSELTDWISARQEFFFTEPYNLQIEMGSSYHWADMEEDLVAFSENRKIFLTGNSFHVNWPEGSTSDPRGAFTHMFAAAVRECWGSEIEAVYRSFRRSNIHFQKLGEFQGQPIVAGAYKVSRGPSV